MMENDVRIFINSIITAIIVLFSVIFSFEQILLAGKRTIIFMIVFLIIGAFSIGTYACITFIHNHILEEK